MKKILVLGSKPNAQTPLCDEVYCANAAIGYYKNEIRDIPLKVNVISANELNPKYRISSSTRRDLYFEKYKLITDSIADTVILCAPQNNYETLFDSDLKKIESISSKKRREITKSITGYRDPIFTSSFRELSFLYKKEILTKTLKCFVKKMWGRHYEFPPFLRPSTGIFSLILAIERNEPDDLFIINGVGFNKRHEYPSGYSDTKAAKPSHDPVDLKLLKHLSKYYRIKTNEIELNEKADIQLLELRNNL